MPEGNKYENEKAVSAEFSPVELSWLGCSVLDEADIILFFVEPAGNWDSPVVGYTEIVKEKEA